MIVPPEQAATTPPVEWTNETHFIIQGVEFTAGNFLSSADGRAALIMKPPDLVREYLALISAEKPERILELGVKEGGSTMLLALAADPKRLLAVDLEEAVPERLENFVTERSLTDRVRVVGGVDQADRSTLSALLDDWFGAEPIDLVIDDASHMFGPSLASFDVCFPRLRSGGVFVLEDWNSDNLLAAAASQTLKGMGAETLERIDQIRSLVLTFNTPGQPLPDGLYERLSVTLGEMNPDERATVGGVSGLVNLIVQVGAKVDLSALPLAPLPLCDLTFMAVLARASSGDIVSEVTVNGEWTVIRRGSAPLDPDTFSVEAVCGDHFGYLRSGDRS